MAGSIVVWLILAVASTLAYIFTHAVLTGAIALIVVMLPPIGLAAAAIASRWLAVTAELPTGIVKEQAVACAFILRNNSIFPFGKLVLHVEAANGFTGETAVFKLFASVPPRRTANVEFNLASAHCGYMKVRCHHVSVCDLFGVLMFPRKLSAEAAVTILPHTFLPEVVLDANARTPEDSDSYSQDKAGNDYSETFQLRDYVPGDSVKQIHWKLSAKQDKLIVRLAGLPLSKSMLVFWDKFPGAVPTADERDAMAEVVASLCQALSEQGFSYTLAWSEPSEQTCIAEAIPDGDALPRVIPGMIKKGDQDVISGAARYVQEKGVPEYARIIYISNALPPEFETFRGNSEVNLLLCSDEGVPALPVRTLCFTAQNYLETMRFMELGA